MNKYTNPRDLDVHCQYDNNIDVVLSMNIMNRGDHHSEQILDLIIAHSKWRWTTDVMHYCNHIDGCYRN